MNKTDLVAVQKGQLDDIVDAVNLKLDRALGMGMTIADIPMNVSLIGDSQKTLEFEWTLAEDFTDTTNVTLGTLSESYITDFFTDIIGARTQFNPNKIYYFRLVVTSDAAMTPNANMVGYESIVACSPTNGTVLTNQVYSGAGHYNNGSIYTTINLASTYMLRPNIIVNSDGTFALNIVCRCSTNVPKVWNAGTYKFKLIFVDEYDYSV